MIDLVQARSVEAERLKKAQHELESRWDLRLLRIDAEMARRGLQKSDARLRAIFEERIEYLRQFIRRRIAIRKNVVADYPELGSVVELNILAETIDAEVMNLRMECQKCNLIMPPEVFTDLGARARDAIDVLKRDMTLAVAFKPKLPEFSLTISHGHAGSAQVVPVPQTSESALVTRRLTTCQSSPVRDTFDAAWRKVDEAIGDVKERDPELAAALGQLASKIGEANPLADERIVCLEQVQFLAEQAKRIPALRRTSVIKGILLALRTSLNDIPSIAPALKTAMSLLVKHFGI